MMPGVLRLGLLLAAACSLVSGQGLPFQVNSRRTCSTKISLDTTTLTGIQRGDEYAPCSGDLMYTDIGKTAQLCGSEDYGLSSYAAERACYTLGVNFYRDTTAYHISGTRQMKLYRCSSYREQNAKSAVSSIGNDDIFLASEYIDIRQETGCRDEMADPDAYDCFDTCYFSDPDYSSPSFNDQDSCDDNRAKFTIVCADINECQTGVHDYCTGPFESSCSIRAACGNNTDCTNHAGSFECSCKDGYEYRSGNDFDPYDLDEGCKDIDECKLSKCDSHAKCVNTIGSFLCWCKNGFTGDGKTCKPITCKNLPHLPNAVKVAKSNNQEYGDTAVYDCAVGHQVSVQNLPEHLVNYYGFTTTDTFTLTCDEKGDWGPYPLPQCIPVDCGDPGTVDTAARTGTSFLYDQDVVYVCNHGYTLTDATTTTSFSITCQADGTWTQTTSCVDIDECEETPHVCPEDNQHCINTPGSYLCLVSFPDTCELLDGITLCKNGKCEMSEGKAQCVCNSGYEGLLCETPTMNTALIVAIVALVLVGLHILMYLVKVCCRCHKVLHAPAPLPPLPPCPKPFGPKCPSYRFCAHWECHAIEAQWHPAVCLYGPGSTVRYCMQLACILMN